MVRVFRYLIAFDVAVVLVITAINYADPAGPAEPFVARYGPIPVAAAACVAIAFVVGLPLLGLALFQWWARWIVSLQAAIYVAASARLGAAATSGLLAGLTTAENMLFGAILALAWCPPLADRFRRGAGGGADAG